jgi:hypothetical protein
MKKEKMEKNKKSITQRYITKRGRQMEFRNVWLLYNFDNYLGHFWAKRDAKQEANKNTCVIKDVKETYQILRGDIKIKIHNDPYYNPKKIIRKKKKIFYCDNCGGKVNLFKNGFQCGLNDKGKIANWCSEKCFKKHKK